MHTHQRVIKLIRKAELGDVKSQFDLASLYYTVKFVEQNYEIARYWFEKAAAQGHEDAIFNLRLCEMKMNTNIVKNAILSILNYKSETMANYLYTKKRNIIRDYSETFFIWYFKIIGNTICKKLNISTKNNREERNIIYTQLIDILKNDNHISYAFYQKYIDVFSLYCILDHRYNDVLEIDDYKDILDLLLIKFSTNISRYSNEDEEESTKQILEISILQDISEQYFIDKILDYMGKLYGIELPTDKFFLHFLYIYLLVIHCLSAIRLNKVDFPTQLGNDPEKIIKIILNNQYIENILYFEYRDIYHSMYFFVNDLLSIEDFHNILILFITKGSSFNKLLTVTAFPMVDDNQCLNYIKSSYESPRNI